MVDRSRRALAPALSERPLLFEATPPSARALPSRADQHLERLVAVVRRFPRIDLVDVPELVDENHEGRPYYRSGDVRAFGRRIAEATGCAVAVNKVVAHLASGDAVGRWARETAHGGVSVAILVGGSSRYIPYPGPPVVEANRLAGPHFEAIGGRIGNIAIPQRTGEAHRLLAKTRAGASFFTTQILFDSRATREMIEEYDALCRSARVPPASVILSFAPMIDEGDVEFVRWLGAEIPDEAERGILDGEDPEGAARRSIAHAIKIWDEVEAGLGPSEARVPVGVNVEEIMPRHLEAAEKMLAAFVEHLDARPVRPRARTDPPVTDA